MEIKRDPIESEDEDGMEYISFDENHTHADIVRYLLSDNLTPTDIYEFAVTAYRDYGWLEVFDG